MTKAARGAHARREFLDDCDEIVRIVKGSKDVPGLRAVGPDLIERAAIPVADGYGAGRGYDGGSGGKGGHGDPVLAKVIPLVDGPDPDRPAPDPDPLATEVARARAHVHDAVVNLRRAVNDLDAASRVPAAEREPDSEASGCVVCHRFDVWSIVHKAGRCRACYEYRRRNDRDAPGHVVLARTEVTGKRQMADAGVVERQLWSAGTVVDLPVQEPGPERELDQTA